MLLCSLSKSLVLKVSELSGELVELASGSILRDLAGYAGPGCVQTQVGPLACDQKGDRYAQHTAQFLVTHRCLSCWLSWKEV